MKKSHHPKVKKESYTAQMALALELEPTSVELQECETELQHLEETSASADVACDPVTVYLREAGRFSRLSKEEEHALALKVRAEVKEGQGNFSARNAMMEANLLLVVMVAKKYLNKGLELSDLIQEGNLALLKAACQFDPALKTRFSTYATCVLRSALLRALQNKGSAIRIPVYMHGTLKKLNKASAALFEEHRALPSSAALAEALNTTELKVRELQDLQKPLVSIHQAISGSSGEGTWEDIIVDKNAWQPDAAPAVEELHERLTACLDGLTPEEQAVVKYRFGLKTGKFMDENEVAEELQIARNVVCRIQEEAIGKIRAKVELAWAA